MANHKLHYRTKFGGLPISVENRKGSHRHWYDPNSGEKGSTEMKYPYGYIKGTLGMDGDAVDVFLGPNKDSERVFVITQNKKPNFSEVDEQKVMLGFDSPEAAKKAYMEHYDSPKFFRNMKEFTLDEFVGKLTSHKGKLIKGSLPNDDNSGKIQSSIHKTFVSEAQRKYMFAAAERGDIPQSVVDEFADKTPKHAKLPEHKSDKEKKSMSTAADDMKTLEKALSSIVVSALSRRARLVERLATQGQAQEVKLDIGITRKQDMNEPPLVPVRTIERTMAPVGEPEIFKSCNRCGRMNKSTTCDSCQDHSSETALPLWRR